MSTSLNIIGTAESSGLVCRLEFDEYVPLRFRTYDQPIGATYIRLGNYSTTLMELIIDPHSNCLRGLTITSYDKIHSWPSLVATTVSHGLPILAAEFGSINRIDLRLGFEISVRPSEILVSWETLYKCDAITFSDHVQFLIHEGRLIGARFVGLSDRESHLFASHA